MRASVEWKTYWKGCSSWSMSKSQTEVLQLENDKHPHFIWSPQPQGPSSFLESGLRWLFLSQQHGNCIPTVKLHAGAVKPHVHAEISKPPRSPFILHGCCVGCGNVFGDPVWFADRLAKNEQRWELISLWGALT